MMDAFNFNQEPHPPLVLQQRNCQGATPYDNPGYDD